jgi:MFS family permease
VTHLAERSPTFRSALRERDFRLLLSGHGLATIAQLVLTLALGIEVLARTSSGVWVSVTVALGFLPYVIFSGYAGVLADRHSRSRVLTVSFVSRAVCAALLAAGLLLQWSVPVLITVTAAAAVLATPSYPALTAGTLQCVPDRQLPAANALVIAVENVTWMAGPGVLGLILLSGQGPVLATVIAVVLFVVAGIASGRVRLPRPPGADAGPRAGEIWDGLRLVAFEAPVRRPMTVAVIDNFLYGYLVVAMVLLAEQMLGGDRAVGWLNAGLSAGALVAMLVINRLAGHRRPAPVLLVVMSMFCVCTGLIGLIGWVPGLVALVAICGASTLIAEVMSVTLLQRAAPEEQLARVFGVYDQLNVGAIGLGSLVAGPLAAQVGSDVAIVAVAVGALVLSVAAASRIHAPARHRADQLPRRG